MICYGNIYKASSLVCFWTSWTKTEHKTHKAIPGSDSIDKYRTEALLIISAFRKKNVSAVLELPITLAWEIVLHNSGWQAIFEKDLKFGSPPQPCIWVLIAKSKLELSWYQSLHFCSCIYLVSHYKNSCFYLLKGSGSHEKARVCLLCAVWVSGTHLLQRWICQNVNWGTHIGVFYTLLGCHVTSTQTLSVF